MSTSRPPDPSSHTADLGAQYITATVAYAKSHHRYNTHTHTSAGRGSPGSPGSSTVSKHADWGLGHFHCELTVGVNGSRPTPT